MRYSKLLVALAVAAATSSTFAADQLIDLSSGYAAFGSTAPLLLGGDDVITFANLAAGTYDFAVTVTSQRIDDMASSLNGQALSVTPAGIFRYAGLVSVGQTPLLLTVTGTQISSPLASYSVTMSALPVPEPATWGLMAAGLGMVGFLAKRRGA